jgi:uncharacterized membrane protein YhhN
MELLGLLIAFLLGVVCYQAAAAKGRNRWVWGTVGFFLPIVGLLFVALLPRVRENAV